MSDVRKVGVLVVGGGAVGLAAALAAKRTGHSVVVLEQGPKWVWRQPGSVAPESDNAVDGGDHLLMPDESRVYALAPASIELLRSLGAWPVASGWFRPGHIHAMSVYERASRGQIDLAGAADDGERPGMAAVVPHTQLMRALVEACERDGLSIEYGQSVSSVVNQATTARAETEAGTRFEATLILAADGANSGVRERLNIPVDGASYRQFGVTALLSLSAPHGGVARQHFRNGEVIALLPLADRHRCVLVWSAREPHAEQLVHMPEPAFLKELNEALALDSLVVQMASDRRAFPLRWQRALSMHEGRVLLLGDAAHVIHPLAGQGLNLGLGDVGALAAGPLPCLGQPGFGRALGRYVRARKADALLYRAATDGLFRLFNLAPARRLRGAGLGLVNRVGPLKRAIVRHASGAQLAPELFQKEG